MPMLLRKKLLQMRRKLFIVTGKVVHINKIVFQKVFHCSVSHKIHLVLHIALELVRDLEVFF